MKRIDFRTFFGLALILLGGLMLLEKFGFLQGAANIFFGIAFFLAAAYFFYLFLGDTEGRWWAIIPSMALLGMGGSAVLPVAFNGIAGGFFLFVLGLAFMIVYIMDRSRWWGLIPGGVLITLGAVASLDKSNWVSSGSLFFVGLGLTFLLVAILPNTIGKMQWAYIPAVVLVLMGALLGSQATAGLADYIWPVALIIVGLVVIFRFFLVKD